MILFRDLNIILYIIFTKVQFHGLVPVRYNRTSEKFVLRHITKNIIRRLSGVWRFKLTNNYNDYNQIPKPPYEEESNTQESSIEKPFISYALPRYSKLLKTSNIFNNVFKNNNDSFSFLKTTNDKFDYNEFSSIISTSAKSSSSPQNTSSTALKRTNEGSTEDIIQRATRNYLFSNKYSTFIPLTHSFVTKSYINNNFQKKVTTKSIFKISQNVNGNKKIKSFSNNKPMLVIEKDVFQKQSKQTVPTTQITRATTFPYTVSKYVGKTHLSSTEILERKTTKSSIKQTIPKSKSTDSNQFLIPSKTTTNVNCFSKNNSSSIEDCIFINLSLPHESEQITSTSKTKNIGPTEIIFPKVKSTQFFLTTELISSNKFLIPSIVSKRFNSLSKNTSKFLKTAQLHDINQFLNSSLKNQPNISSNLSTQKLFTKLKYKQTFLSTLTNKFFTPLKNTANHSILTTDNNLKQNFSILVSKNKTLTSSNAIQTSKPVLIKTFPQFKSKQTASIDSNSQVLITISFQNHSSNKVVTKISLKNESTSSSHSLIPNITLVNNSNFGMDKKLKPLTTGFQNKMTTLIKTNNIPGIKTKQLTTEPFSSNQLLSPVIVKVGSNPNLMTISSVKSFNPLRTTNSNQLLTLKILDSNKLYETNPYSSIHFANSNPSTFSTVDIMDSSLNTTKMAPSTTSIIMQVFKTNLRSFADVLPNITTTKTVYPLIVTSKMTTQISQKNNLTSSQPNLFFQTNATTKQFNPHQTTTHQTKTLENINKRSTFSSIRINSTFDKFTKSLTPESISGITSTDSRTSADSTTFITPKDVSETSDLMQLYKTNSNFVTKSTSKTILSNSVKPRTLTSKEITQTSPQNIFVKVFKSTTKPLLTTTTKNQKTTIMEPNLFSIKTSSNSSILSTHNKNIIPVTETQKGTSFNKSDFVHKSNFNLDKTITILFNLNLTKKNANVFTPKLTSIKDQRIKSTSKNIKDFTQNPFLYIRNIYEKITLTPFFSDDVIDTNISLEPSTTKSVIFQTKGSKEPTAKIPYFITQYTPVPGESFDANKNSNSINFTNLLFRDFGSFILRKNPSSELPFTDLLFLVLNGREKVLSENFTEILFKNFQFTKNITKNFKISNESSFSNIFSLDVIN